MNKKGLSGFIFFGELVHQLSIFAAVLPQFKVIAPFNELPSFQDKDHILIFNGAEPVGHGNHRTGGKDIFNGPLNVLIGERINRTGGIFRNTQMKNMKRWMYYL